MATVVELGYVPNALARSLHVKRTHTLALVLTDIGNPFFTTIARGVEDAASSQGFSVMFCNTDESEEEEAAHVRVLLQKQVDGLLLVPAASSSRRPTWPAGAASELVDAGSPRCRRRRSTPSAATLKAARMPWCAT